MRRAFNEVRENPYLGALAAVGLAKGLNEVYLQDHLSAKRAWGALAVGIIAYEILCPKTETMSEGADRLIERHPLLTRLGIGVLACHVANLTPNKYDPVHLLLGSIKGAL